MNKKRAKKDTKDDAMRVDVQKPIQSLHAFMRHHFGEGGLNGSSPNLKSLLTTVVVVLSIGTGVLSAQDGSEPDVRLKDEKQLDVMFDRIMQTLPEGERTKVDSAASVKNDRKKVSDNGTTPPSGNDNIITPRERLQELPDELKAQVERVITDMEQRKEDRKAQFRESLRNR